MLSNIYDGTGVFEYFEQISLVPRGSKNNKKISDFLVQFAKEHKLEYRQDEYENVIIKKPASKGYENAPVVMLQGHMDMVCEKVAKSSHDFMKEPLQLQTEGDYIYAKDTTLGGDDGIALAYALAILADNTKNHPALEVVITTDEEVGMEGAYGLDTSDLKAAYLLNLDSEEEGVFLVSCAGGLTGSCIIPMECTNKMGVKVNLIVKGLKGGHSGIEIDKNRVNSNILLGRLLYELSRHCEFDIIEGGGGLKDNAIPIESQMSILVSKEELSKLEQFFLECTLRYEKEYKKAEPDLCLELKVEGDRNREIQSEVITAKKKDDLLFFFLMTPNGVQTMSSHIPDLVESSLNMGKFLLTLEKAEFCYSIRSSLSSYKEFLSNRLEVLCEKLDGIYTIRGQYPAWEYREYSKLRELVEKVYREQYGTNPKLEAVHAGLECGILAEKLPHLDMISMGPEMHDIHTTKEKLSISSAKRVYQFLLTLLEQIKE